MMGMMTIVCCSIMDLGSNFTVTATEAMEAMSEKDLAFIATYHPNVLNTLCIMSSLELELIEEGKLSIHEPVILKTRKPQSRFVYSWYKFKTWLFSNLQKMGLLKR